MIDLTISARRDGSGDDDGMRLGELERCCAALRRNGGTDGTCLDVRTNRAHRIRQVTALNLDDTPPAENPPPEDPDQSPVPVP